MQRSLAALALVTLATACGQPPTTTAKTDFVVADPALAAELRLAAEQWAAAGLDVAAYVTINQNADGIPVRERTHDELMHHCNDISPETTSLDGCAEHDHAHGTFRGLWVADDLTPERRAAVLAHELVHLLVPSAEHLPDGVPAIFSVHCTSYHVTDADMRQLARYTDVTVAMPWPESESESEPQAPALAR